MNNATKYRTGAEQKVQRLNIRIKKQARLQQKRHFRTECPPFCNASQYGCNQQGLSKFFDEKQQL